MGFLGVIGFKDDATVREETGAELRRARIAAARAVPRWTEIDPVDMVERDRFLVSASTDAYYLPARGAQFAPGVASVIADRSELAFVVVDDELSFFEQVRNPPTWTERIERQTAKELRRNAPRQKPSWMDRRP